jgi:hypothetical protein
MRCVVTVADVRGLALTLPRTTEHLVAVVHVGDPEPGGERPVAGQQRERGQRIGGPTEDPLELVRDVLGDLHRQPQAGQVGEVPPGDVAEVNVRRPCPRSGCAALAAGVAAGPGLRAKLLVVPSGSTPRHTSRWAS